jgi:hypothetical protein
LFFREDTVPFGGLEPGKQKHPFRGAQALHQRTSGSLGKKNLRAWLDKVGLLYHSPHKFRHGHIQYGLSKSKTVADFKAVSLNVMHASMEITDEFYSNLNDGELENRISSLNKSGQNLEDSELELFRQFLEWKKN